MFLINKNYWEVKKTRSKGFGIFLKKEIKKGTIIGDYLGEVIKTSEYDLENDKKGLFLMYLTDELCVYPDLKAKDIHLINHSCNPNCWIYPYFGHTLFFAIRNIKSKEELTISYLLSPKEDCNPCTHDCRCGEKNCVGTMHMTKEKFIIWQEYLNNRKTNTESLKYSFGKKLPKLRIYPKISKNNSIFDVIKKLA